MQIGVNEYINSEILRYYELFYDILPTPDFDNAPRLLKPTHGIYKIGYSSQKICRFCGKSENEVSFKMVAHVFPESIGNHVLVSNYECDECNKYFGQTIENEYANYFNLYHSIMQIAGKKGVQKCKYKVPCEMRTDQCGEYCVDISFVDNEPCIRKCSEVGEKYISLSNNSISISKPIGKCCPIAVFKAIVKMAISVMPIEELPLFKDVIEWICEPEHSNFYKDKKLLVRYKIIPGFNVTKYPHYALYRRKKDAWNYPYMIFNLTYGCYSIFIEIPRDNDNSTNCEFENMPFPPIPFHTSAEEIRDLSNDELPKDAKQTMILNFDAMKECNTI